MLKGKKRKPKLSGFCQIFFTDEIPNAVCQSCLSRRAVRVPIPKLPHTLDAIFMLDCCQIGYLPRKWLALLF